MKQFGLWREILAVLLNPKGPRTILSSKSGRLIYEEFDANEKQPSESSRFFVVQDFKVKEHNTPKGVIIELLIDLEDSQHCAELKE